MLRRTASALAAVALAAAAAACGGSGDKAGGSPAKKPVVLTLQNEEVPQLSGAPEFVEEVERLSEGSMRIEVVEVGHGGEIDYERSVVEDVRAGKAQLGIVPVRVWDTMGVTGFQALLAPFLVDSLELERKVLESPLADEMLAGVENAGVVGVVLLPGPLRRPFGITRALVRPGDYRGATIGVRIGGVARAASQALAAIPRSYVSGTLGAADGAEADPTTIALNEFDGVALTANVVLWPKPYSIVMNREAFDRLTLEQREILHRAGGEAFEPELRQIEQDEASAVSKLCVGLSFVTAPAPVLSKLRKAVEPVYGELERTAQTREFLAQIEEMKRGLPADVLEGTGCRSAEERAKPRGFTTDPSALEATWETAWTREKLIAVGVAPPDAEAISGHHTLEFADGRFRGKGDPGSGTSATGTYTVNGDILMLVFESGIAVQLGRRYKFRWSVYRDSLVLAPISAGLEAFRAAPYTRVP